MKTKDYRGITLIALIITIIVLLILAGVSISMVVGDNGILSQAVNASTATDIADTKEQIELALIGYYDESGNYTDEDVEIAVQEVLGDEASITESAGTYTVTTAKGNIVDITELMTGAVSTKINWSEILANLADEEERQEYLENAVSQGQSASNTNIGIGTDGQAVNLDLWNYYTNGDSTMDLGFHYGGSDYGVGYKGTITDGAIEGTIPQYIYISSEDKIYTVTRLVATFQGLSYLSVASEIPDTVTTLYSTFNGCGLTSIIIPDSVTNIEYYAFYNCRFTQINYNGTVSEWKAIEKSNNWNYGSSITTIICTDGEITL